MFKRVSSIILTLCILGFASGCGGSDSGKNEGSTVQTSTTKPKPKTNLPKIDMTKWEYNADCDIYCQGGIVYCEAPADEHYEQLMLFVPGAYMDATDNGDNTYTCKLNEKAELNGYTSSTAPILMPVNTPYYAASELPPVCEAFMPLASEYASQGCVLVYPGCRGANEGAPAGVTDLKAAIRYIRYCDDVLAGDAESIFVHGMSGGGAQAAVVGASGDSELYAPYLDAIGAVQGVSDAVAGIMSWCPVTSLDTANAEYEWMMGCTRPKRSAEEQAISDELAKAYAEYVNKAGFTDKDGNALTLEESEEGIYQAGTYYDYVKNVIERSLNNYLSDTPFTEKYTAQSCIDELNKDRNWITYDKDSNTATITSIADFAKTCKIASESLVAFDPPHTNEQSGDKLFGYGDGKSSHFDKLLADVLDKLNSKYADEYKADFTKKDTFGNTVEQRLNMYSPLYYLMNSREGHGKSTIAKHWRIRTGIKQPSTSLTTEINLALALEGCEGVDVDFETVWAQEHTEAERTGTSTENFLNWVNESVKK